MSSKVMDEIKQIIEAKAQAQPTPIEFELAYQARVAMDRIRFAIKHTEQFAPRTDQMQEARLQLLDALERLETAERSFQRRFRTLVPLVVVREPQAQAINGSRDQKNAKGIV